jgi:glycosyltransferase involved in cell wall biosynthesis
VNRIRHVAVVIPARNEAATIEATIDSVDEARSQLPGEVTSSCFVVVDASVDDTGAVIERRSQRRGLRDDQHLPTRIVEVAHGCVGAARSAGCRFALDSARHEAGRVWLANTDADTVVPSFWLFAQLDLAERDVGAIAGIVELAPDADDRVRTRFAASYELSSDGTHRHVHGANLGVRGDAYLLAGGWRPLPTGEDHDLWLRLGRCTDQVSSTAITVTTSARTSGRAPLGFANDIAQLMDAAAPAALTTEPGETTVA